MKLEGTTVRRLMRKHRRTIRGIATQYGITMRRVRQVRMHGVDGFLGDEWHFLITGRWPDEEVPKGAGEQVGPAP